MGALDVILLRDICSSHAERTIMPLLQEMQQRMTRLEEALGEKADAARVPSLAQFDALAAEAKASVREGTALDAQTEALMKKLDDKADALSVPSMTHFEEMVGKMQSEHATDIDARLETLMQKVEALSSRMNSRSEKKDLATTAQLQELAAEVECKANIRDVPSNAQFSKLSSAMEKKAGLGKVNAQISELQEAVALKVDAKLVPTLAQVEELAAQVKRKADSSSIASTAQLNKILAELQLKANTEDVVSATEGVTLREKVDRVMQAKAESDDVPSLAQHKEFAAATERKLAFLAAKVQKNTANNQEWQAQAIYCVPQVVELPWDENQQQWSEWNGNGVSNNSTPTGNNNGAAPNTMNSPQMNIFVPHKDAAVGPRVGRNGRSGKHHNPIGTPSVGTPMASDTTVGTPPSEP